jgi:hypothetical protein
MKQQELVAKLQQIEEQARLTLEEYPKTLTRERQRMIIALAKYIRSELDEPSLPRDEPSAPRDSKRPER